jgi:hypothetical protein
LEGFSFCFVVVVGLVELINLAKCSATLRVFIKNFKKKFQKKISKKKIQNFSVNLFAYLSSAANLGPACKKFGGLGPLVWA